MRAILAVVSINSLDRRQSNFRNILVLLDMSTSYVGELSLICPVTVFSDWIHIAGLQYQRCTPRLSMCAVARKSPVGEKVMLVAIDAVRNASISRPVGMSNVRIVESREEAVSHLESGEKHW